MKNATPQSLEAKDTAIANLKQLEPGIHFDTAHAILRADPAFDPESIEDRIYIMQQWGPPLTLEPPTITVLSPDTAPAGVDALVDITGTGFYAGSTVNIGAAHSLVPASISPTDLSVLFSGTAHIQFPGTLPVSVTSSGQTSNALDFTVS